MWQGCDPDTLGEMILRPPRRGPKPATGRLWSSRGLGPGRGRGLPSGNERRGFWTSFRHDCFGRGSGWYQTLLLAVCDAAGEVEFSQQYDSRAASLCLEDMVERLPWRCRGCGARSRPQAIRTLGSLALFETLAGGGQRATIKPRLQHRIGASGRALSSLRRSSWPTTSMPCRFTPRIAAARSWGVEPGAGRPPDRGARRPRTWPSLSDPQLAQPVPGGTLAVLGAGHRHGQALVLPSGRSDVGSGLASHRVATEADTPTLAPPAMRVEISLTLPSMRPPSRSHLGVT